MIVLDAPRCSILLLAQITGRVNAGCVWKLRPTTPHWSPHWLVDRCQAVRRYAANGEIDVERGRAALDDFADSAVKTVST